MMLSDVRSAYHVPSRNTAISDLPSPSKSAGTGLSVAIPNWPAVKPADDRLRYQTLFDGRNTAASAFPSLS
jgi:hypothetical protein